VAERIRTMLAEGVPTPLAEERFVRLDGTGIDVEAVATPITFAGETAVLVVFRDVTERNRMERALAEAEAKYRTLVERIPAIVYFAEFGEPAPWLYVSPQIESILGYTPQEWIADEALWMQQIHPADLERVFADERHSRDTGDPFACEYRMFSRDGRVVWIRDEAEVVPDESGAPAMLRGIMYDVTDRKRVEEALRQSLILLQRTDEDRRRLLARVVEAQEEERCRIADDIHDDSIQVVTAVGLRLASLERRLEDSALRESVSQLSETVRAAITRLRNLLFELRPRSLDQEGLAATLRMYLDQVSEQSGIAYGIENRLVSEPPPDTRTALYRIAQEALMNVRKHAGATKVDVLLEAREHGYFIRIKDDGGGFDPDSIQVVNGHLGLPAMRERAEMAGGWCRIDSRAGAGTTVELWLPDPS
jgi:PAS domain S-box-containing protein